MYMYTYMYMYMYLYVNMYMQLYMYMYMYTYMYMYMYKPVFHQFSMDNSHGSRGTIQGLLVRFCDFHLSMWTRACADRQRPLASHITAGVSWMISSRQVPRRLCDESPKLTDAKAGSITCKKTFESQSQTSQLSGLKPFAKPHMQTKSMFLLY